MAQQARDADAAQCCTMFDFQAQHFLGCALTIGSGGGSFLNHFVPDNDALFFELQEQTSDGVVINNLEISWSGVRK